ncbi:MAG: hypothetical protein EXS09_19280 [Gemmataceae bacterium]|nr:hypothetical protein [Gemmataceae bacterium]
MRTAYFASAVALSVLLCPGSGFGQGNNVKEKKLKPPPDEFRAVLSAVEEAYKAPREVDKDVLDELRKQYRDPKPEREAKIFREIRRLYETTPELEQTILTEIRRAYEQPSAEQEERIFNSIRRAPQLPLGTVPIQAQAELAEKLFRKLDQDGNGFLGSDEMSELLHGQRAQWDKNRDGLVSFEEYGAYYQAQLKSVSEQVASGELPLKLPKGTVSPDAAPSRIEEPRPIDGRPAKPLPDLPRWFAECDLDADGQVGLHEWRKLGHAIKEFLVMDGNKDGFLEASELRAFLADSSSTIASKLRSR